MKNKEEFNKLLKDNLTNIDSSADFDKKKIPVLINFLQEYLSGFCLFGYNINGDDVSIIVGENQKDYDALETMIKKVDEFKVFSDINSKRRSAGKDE